MKRSIRQASRLTGQPVIRAAAVILTDRQGRERARLAIEDDQPVLRLTGSDGAQCLLLPDGLLSFDEQGAAIIEVAELFHHKNTTSALWRPLQGPEPEEINPEDTEDISR